MQANCGRHAYRITLPRRLRLGTRSVRSVKGWGWNTAPADGHENGLSPNRIKARLVASDHTISMSVLRACVDVRQRERFKAGE